MITCHLIGGLGNQLFQIFATIAYSMQYNIPFGFLYRKSLGGRYNNRQTYWHSFLYSLKQFNHSSIPPMLSVKEQNFMYNELPSPIAVKTDNISLFGYFQSYKYFDSHFTSICNLIRLDKQKEHCRKDSNYVYDNMISMHFRLGDYKYLQNYHPLMTNEYYRQSIQHIINLSDPSSQSTYQILYFCEKEDNEEVLTKIQYLQKIFPECQFIKAEDNKEDWEQLLMMSCCKHNIIANSSFSWWGAYFNTKPDKIVCYPSTWFGPSNNQNNTIDMFPDQWSKI